jgi:hypothetical protein
VNSPFKRNAELTQWSIYINHYSEGVSHKSLLEVLTELLEQSGANGNNKLLLCLRIVAMIHETSSKKKFYRMMLLASFKKISNAGCLRINHSKFRIWRIMTCLQ